LKVGVVGTGDCDGCKYGEYDVFGLAFAEEMGVEKLVAYCKGAETEGKGKLGCEEGPPTGGWAGRGGPGAVYISEPNPASLREALSGKGFS
jgi:hypothetical protein